MGVCSRNIFIFLLYCTVRLMGGDTDTPEGAYWTEIGAFHSTFVPAFSVIRRRRITESRPCQGKARHESTLRAAM